MRLSIYLSSILTFTLLAACLSSPRIVQAQVQPVVKAPVAVTAQNAAMTTAANAQTDEQPSPLTLIGNDYHNSIELMRNRFRVDNNVKEMTLIFFRENGSAPVVLVRPDGSKIFETYALRDDVDWYDAANFDMITLRNPVPGPWQAVGQIKPDSRVMVLSELQLHVKPLPDLVFSGEVLKVTAELTNGGKPIEYGDFRDVVDIEVVFASSNNPNFNNFGARDEGVALFSDDGLGMDEIPRDGVFTGQFNLDIAHGEWKPIYRVTTPMFSREQVDPPTIVRPNPVLISTEQHGGGDGYHKLILDVERDVVDIESLLIDGKLQYPNGETQNFSITEPSSEPREYLIGSPDPGIFRVKMTAYGATLDGREFILDVPEYTFLVERQIPVTIGSTELDGTSEQGEGVQDLEQMMGDAIEAEPEPQPEPDFVKDNFMLILIAVNGTILFIGLLVIVVLILKRRKHSKAAQAAVATTKGGEQKAAPVSKKASPTENELKVKTTFIDKIMRLVKKKPKDDASE